MKSNAAKISAICASGIAIGTVATVAAVLLTANTDLADYTDKDLIKSGFETIFNIDEACDIVRVMENLSGKSNTISGELKINNIYDDTSIAVDSTFGFISDTDLTNNKLNLYFYADSPVFSEESTEEINATVYYGDDKFAITSNLINNVLYINTDTFIEDYQNSIFYDGNDTDLEVYKSSLDALDKIIELINDNDRFDNLKEKLKNKLSEDIDVIFDNMTTERASDSESINGTDAYCITGNISVSDVLTLAFNQLQIILTDEDFLAYCDDYMQFNPLSYFFIGINSEKPSEALKELSLKLTMGYGLAESSVKSVIGDTLPVKMYFDANAALIRTQLSININPNTDLDIDEPLYATFTLDYLGKDKLTDSYEASLNLKEDNNNSFDIILSNIKEDNNRTIELSFLENDDAPIKMVSNHSTNGSAFTNKTLFYNGNIEVACIDANGTYEADESSINLEIDSFKLTASANTLLDASLKLCIKPLDKELTMPEGEAINLLKLTETELDKLLLSIEEIED